MMMHAKGMKWPALAVPLLTAVLFALVAVAASISVAEWKESLLASEPQEVSPPSLQTKATTPAVADRAARIGQRPCNSSAACGAQDRHGQCGADGRCVCQGQWAGQDCSICTLSPSLNHRALRVVCCMADYVVCRVVCRQR